MIKIDLNTARFKLTITGHAMPEERPDYKAICTSVSALAESLAYTISKCETDHNVITGMDYRNEPGDFLLKVTPESWAEALIRKRYNIYGDGLEMMAKCHPECVQMVWDGEQIIPWEEDENGEQETGES